MSAILANLTRSQRDAVTHVDGPMLVIAGAGSGKTRVVTSRIAYLISKGVWPGQILAMTFTNKAANEMKERVAALVGTAPKWVGTFHSTCARILRQDLEKLGDGRTGRFTIYDSGDQNALVKRCMEELDLDVKRYKPAMIREHISQAKCRMIRPGELIVEACEDQVTALVYTAYEKELRRANAVDFDDLLLLTARLLEKLPHLRDIYHNKFRYLLIDEYQDTNRIQYQLMRLLAGPARNVHVTGDPDQSIYSWRGAEYRNIMDFTKDFPDARLVRLEQNYRSTKTILHAANELIRNNSERIDKELFTENSQGVKVRLVCLADDRGEADWVAERVFELRAEACDLKEMAVFYRTNAQSRSFEEALIGLGIPYQIVGGIRFYERKEIKDLLAHLKLLVNPRDVISLERVLATNHHGVGSKTLAKLLAICEKRGEAVFEFLQRDDFAEHYDGRVSKKLAEFARWCRQLGKIPFAPVADCVHEVFLHAGMQQKYAAKLEVDPKAQDRIDNLDAFVDRAVEFQFRNPEFTLPDFLQDVALVADVDSWDDASDCLSLMTLHSSKGLEFPFVFIVGVEEGYLPHSNADTLLAGEEERRLFYVGITRARQEVAVTHAATRYMWGETGERQPSSFLSEFPEDAVERIDLSMEW